MPDPTTEVKSTVETTPAESRPGEIDLVEWVDQLYSDAERAKRDIAREAEWENWLKGFWGDVWDVDLPTFKAPIVVNLLKTRMLQEVSDLTDSPTKVFVQKDRSKADRDQGVEKFIQAFWTAKFIDIQIMLAALDAMIYPCGFVGVTYDPTADWGRGDLIVRPRDPYTVYPDPDCTNDDDWRFVILKDVMDCVQIRQLWPDQGKRVRADQYYSLKADDNQGRRGPRMTGGKLTGPLYAGGMQGTATDGYIKSRAAVLSVFIKDDTVEEDAIERMIEKVNDETGEKVMEPQIVMRKLRKYPHGRLIQVANGVVLYDGPNPYVGRFPVVRVTLQPTVHQFWAPQSPLSDVLEVYRAANKLDSLVVENGLRLNGGLLIADANSGIDVSQWANIPGQGILKAPGTEVKVQYPAPMPADIVNAGKLFRGYADEVLGFQPSRIGAGQRGNVSPELTETEITQALGISRLRGRLLHNSVQKLVEVIFAGMAKFYSAPRIIPHARGDRWEPASWMPVPSPEAFAIHVDPASFKIKSQTLLQRLYFTLAKMGKMPNEDLLNALDIPNAQEVSEKLNKQLQAEAWAGYNKAKRGKKGGP